MPSTAIEKNLKQGLVGQQKRYDLETNKKKKKKKRVRQKADNNKEESRIRWIKGIRECCAFRFHAKGDGKEVV